jgi:hypothetical protein
MADIFEVMPQAASGIAQRNHKNGTNQMPIASELPGLRLRMELVPRPLWGRNLRSPDAFGQVLWEKYRNFLITEPGVRCAVCCAPVQGSSGWMDYRGFQCHEVWEYQEKKTVGTAVLLRVAVTCIYCHDVHHFGSTKERLMSGKITIDQFDDRIKHFCEVNQCGQDVFNTHYWQSFDIFARRNKKQWKIDWGDFDFAVGRAERCGPKA